MLVGTALGTAQRQAPFAVELVGGGSLAATRVTGGPAAEFVVTTAQGERRLAHATVLAIVHTKAVAPPLPRAMLAGGDRLYGRIAGGDDIGDTLVLLSPVLGRVDVPVDRLAAFVQPGVDLADQRLPEGVDEALFLPTGRGFDLVAGTLHRFGPGGVKFAPERAEAAQWYAPERFSSLRLRGALPREGRAECLMLTRTADRVGVEFLSADEGGVNVQLETGARAQVRWADVACLVFRAGVVHLADLEPVEVVESGYDSEVSLPWRRDRAVSGGELIAKGRAYGRGIGVHSRSRLVFRAPAGAVRFHTRVALDDSALALPIEPQAVARVLRGDTVLFEVDDLAAGQEPRDAGVHAVEPGDTITLEVDFGRGRDLGDRVDWLLPVFVLRGRS